IEAHATATPVGDKVELAALQEAFADRAPGSAAIELGSLKALIGHTGWVSGAASIIKICKALEARIIPRQFNYSAPHPEIQIDESRFRIPLENHPWPENGSGMPRCGGVNSFGFGGTNAHVIIEAFDEPYHRDLCGPSSGNRAAEPSLVIVGVGSLFP